MKGLKTTLVALVLAATLAPASLALEKRPGVKLRALDKITGTATDLTAKAGQTVTFGRLSITARACFQAAPEDTPESAAYLDIKQLPVAAKAGKGAEAEAPRPLFHGWMFASSPGLSALEHPTYDVWVISCTAS